MARSRVKEQEAFAEARSAKARPEGITTEHLEFLDELRESGVTSMFGARPYLMNAFEGMSGEAASAALGYWMKTFGQAER